MKRRDFVNVLAQTALVTSLPVYGFRQPKKKVLILGGTSFVGPYIVQEAINEGFEVVLFNRGITNPNLFPQLRKLRGDRLKKEDVNILQNESWDVVVDTWAKNPYAVKYSTDILSGNVKYYFYVSSIAVYGDSNYRKVGLTEETALPEVGPLPQDVSGLDYTKNKIHSENIIKGAFLNAHGIFRAQIIFGVDMATGSLTNPSIGIRSRAYWPVRIDKGGDVLAPGEKTDTCQYTDVKDMARFIVKCITLQQTGIYNVFHTLTMQDFLESLIKIKNTKGEVNLVWVPADFLFSKGIESVSDVPMWVSHQEEGNGFFQISNNKAIKAGLGITPVTQTFKEIKSAFYRFHSDFDFTNRLKIACLEKQLLDEFKQK